MLPQLPHDNLYKFMAMSGLVSFLAVSYFWYQNSEGEVDFAHENLQQVNQISIDLKYLEKELEHYRYFEKDEKKARWHFIQSMKEIEKKQALRESKQQKIDSAKGKFDFVQSVAGFFMFASYLLMAWGFRMWYVRLQRHLDIMVSKDSVNHPYRIFKKHRRLD